MARINVQQPLLGLLDSTRLGYVSRIEGEGHCQVGFQPNKHCRWPLSEESQARKNHTC